MTAEEFIRNLTQQLQQTHPDFHFKTVGITPSPDGRPQLAAASAEWTNHRGELMGGVVQFTIGPGRGRQHRRRADLPTGPGRRAAVRQPDPVRALPMFQADGAL